MHRTLTAGAVSAGFLFAAAGADARPAAGLLSGAGLDAIVSLDVDQPSNFSSVRAVTGLSAAERLVGIDYRWLPLPAAGAGAAGLYGLGVDPGSGAAHVYRLDAATGAATPIGAGFTVPTASDYAFDFNPAVDRIRIVTSDDVNLRAHPDTGALVATDTALTPGGGKVAAGAYDRVNVAPTTPPGPTTLYVIDATNDTLSTQGSVDSTPLSPNGGALSAVGSLGIGPEQRGANLDIAPDGKAYATLTVGGIPGVYGINLTTGAATLVGNLPVEFGGLAILPDAPAPTPAPTPTPTPTPTPAPADTTAPGISLKVSSSITRSSLIRRGLKVTVTPNEAVKLEVSLNGKVTRARAARTILGSYNLQLVGKERPLASAPQSITLRPKSALVPASRRTQKAQVRVVATDRAGNVTTRTKVISIKR